MQVWKDPANLDAESRRKALNPHFWIGALAGKRGTSGKVGFSTKFGPSGCPFVLCLEAVSGQQRAPPKSGGLAIGHWTKQGTADASTGLLKEFCERSRGSVCECWGMWHRSLELPERSALL